VKEAFYKQGHENIGDRLLHHSNDIRQVHFVYTSSTSISTKNGLFFFFKESCYFNQVVNKFCNYLVLKSESLSDKVTPFMGCTDGHLIPRTCVSNTEHYRHSATNATVTFRNVRRKSNFEVRNMYVNTGQSS
jgi:hypothetical protein